MSDTAKYGNPPILPGQSSAPAAAAPAASGGDIKAQIAAQGNVVRDLKKNKASKAEVTAAVKILLELKAKDGGNAPAEKSKKSKKNKKKNKKKGGDQGKKGGADKTEKEKAKKLKALLKEGGKKGQDMDGMAAFGTEFFCAAVQEPEGNWEYLDIVMSGFNKAIDPSEEERRGGAGGLGKMLFSAGTDRLAILAHVPAELTKKYKGITVQDWLAAVIKDVPQTKLSGKATANGQIQRAEIVADPDNNIFPLKIRDSALQAAYQFLMKNHLCPEESEGDEVDYTQLADDAGVTFNDTDY